ncbi:hypothetical protein ABH20_13050 [Geobacillus sp. T6]|nr:hypothetical protein GT3921_10860 [Geobacillus thermocatenulatus]KLR73078.1 hypothetical protein ABH20_13050 [Geobacillus sp. T6]
MRKLSGYKLESFLAFGRHTITKHRATEGRRGMMRNRWRPWRRLAPWRSAFARDVAARTIINWKKETSRQTWAAG